MVCIHDEQELKRRDDLPSSRISHLTQHVYRKNLLPTISNTQKFIVALALVAALVCVQAQDYDDEGGNQGNDGYGGFSGGGDDDYAAPRDRGVVGAEGSDNNPGYHHGGEENYDDDSAAAASHVRPTISRPSLVKLISKSR